VSSIDSFARLNDEFNHLVKSVDRTILLDYCRRLAPMVYARYFKGFRPQSLGRKRITNALRDEVYERKNEAIGDILTLLWNQARKDVYQAMLDHVKTISEDVETIKEIEDGTARAFIEDLDERFDKRDILICVCLNDVRFSDEVVEYDLKGKAKKILDGDGDNSDN